MDAIHDYVKKKVLEQKIEVGVESLTEKIWNERLRLHRSMKMLLYWKFPDIRILIRDTIRKAGTAVHEPFGSDQCKISEPRNFKPRLTIVHDAANNIGDEKT